MSDGPVCPACGVLVVRERGACATCGTILAPASAVSPDTGVVPATTPEARADRLAGVARVFGASLGITVAATIGARLDAPPALVDAAASTACALVGAICLVAAGRALRPSLATMGGWRGLLGALAGLGVIVAGGAVYFRALGALGFAFQHPTEVFAEAGWPRWAPFLFTAVLPGVFEELVFRGYVMARLEELLSPGETLVVQAALFSVLHLGIAIFPSHFGIGLVLGLVRRRTGSLYPGMAVHISWNALVVWSELLGRSFP